MKPGSDRFFERGSEVIKMTSKKDWKQLEKSNFAWVVAFYRESCGYCGTFTSNPTVAFDELWLN